MKNIFGAGLPILLAALFTFAACDNNPNPGDDANRPGVETVAFVSVSANGGPTQTSTQLTLRFDRAISGLGAGDIILGGGPATGISLGNIGGAPPVYTVQLGNVTQGGTLTVTVSRPGYNILNATRTVTIFHHTEVGGERS